MRKLFLFLLICTQAFAATMAMDCDLFDKAWKAIPPATNTEASECFAQKNHMMGFASSLDRVWIITPTNKLSCRLYAERYSYDCIVTEGKNALKADSIRANVVLNTYYELKNDVRKNLQ